MKRFILGVLVAAFSLATASAQSLQAGSPAPLKAGINESATDNFTGTHYWYFYGGPGAVDVHCVFKGGGLLGNSLNSTLTFTLSDSAGTWSTSKVLRSGSTASAAQTTFHAANLKKRAKIIVTVAPVANGLVRMGGDYQITASGVVAFGAEKAGDPIVGTYMQMNGMTENIGVTKFKVDGTVVAANGFTGTWKLFDADTHTYAVVINGERLSLIYRPAIGLVDASDAASTNPVFKALK
jgi:hypothetical protein